MKKVTIYKAAIVFVTCSLVGMVMYVCSQPKENNTGKSDKQRNTIEKLIDKAANYSYVSSLTLNGNSYLDNDRQEPCTEPIILDSETRLCKEQYDFIVPQDDQERVKEAALSAVNSWYRNEPAMDFSNSEPADIIKVLDAHPEGKGKDFYQVTLRNTNQEITAIITLLSQATRDGQEYLSIDRIRPTAGVFVGDYDGYSLEEIRKNEAIALNGHFPAISEQEALQRVQAQLSSQQKNEGQNRIIGLTNLYIFNSQGDYEPLGFSDTFYEVLTLDGQTAWVSSDNGKVLDSQTLEQIRLNNDHYEAEPDQWYKP